VQKKCETGVIEIPRLREGPRQESTQHVCFVPLEATATRKKGEEEGGRDSSLSGKQTKQTKYQQQKETRTRNTRHDWRTAIEERRTPIFPACALVSESVRFALAGGEGEKKKRK
jgi:hypothetical protein